MIQIEEKIPTTLQAPAEAALAWFNERQGETFEITGILDPDRAFASESIAELRLILCGGDRCEQRFFRVGANTGGYDVELLEETTASRAEHSEPRLDPPPGARRSWLERVLQRHAFVVLVFYRGFW